MALFIVRHQHEPDRCPATDPYMGATLLNYLSRPNVRKHGVSIQGEAVVRGEHALYMIVESSDARGGCAAAIAAVDAAVPALDPEEACQQAIDGGLVVHRAHPLNGETSYGQKSRSQTALLGRVLLWVQGRS
jgi:hypothetical protein